MVRTEGSRAISAYILNSTCFIRRAKRKYTKRIEVVAVLGLDVRRPYIDIH
jgi:hypothetical protein